MSFYIKIKEIQPSLFSYIKSRIYNSHDAQDILQNVNLILVNKKSEYDKNKSFSGWAFKIAKFQIMGFLSHSKRSRLVSSAMDDEASSFLDLSTHLVNCDCPRSIIQKQEEQKSLNQRIFNTKKSLSKNQLDVINLYSEGKKQKQIAKELKMKLGTVSATKSRAIERMKKIIA